MHNKEDFWQEVPPVAPEVSPSDEIAHCDTLQAENMESPLTTPPSSPIPVEGDSVMDSETVAQHSRLSYTHNHVSDIIFIAYFVEVFFGSSFAVFVRMVEQFIAAAGAEGWCAHFASSCPKDTRTLS